MDFDKVVLNLRQAQKELNSFERWIAKNRYFSEADGVLEIKARRHMSCLFGYLILMPGVDLIKFELELKGLFRADLAVGNNNSRQFVFVEFEDAKENSIFEGGTKKYRHWSRRIEHGFGQVLDWGWARYSHPTDVIFTRPFGGTVEDHCYVVVCGRDPDLGSIEAERFEYRRTNVKVSGVNVRFFTYDRMVSALRDILTPILARLR